MLSWPSSYDGVPVGGDVAHVYDQPRRYLREVMWRMCTINPGGTKKSAPLWSRISVPSSPSLAHSPPIGPEADDPVAGDAVGALGSGPAPAKHPPKRANGYHSVFFGI